MADTSEGSLSLVPATTFGVTPATPAFGAMRITSETLTAQFDTFESNELSGDATVVEVRRTGQSGSGDANFELHRGPVMETILAAALRGNWASDVLKGSTQRPHFTLERKVENGATDSYFRFEGARVGGISLNFAPEEAITGVARFMTAGHTASPTPITGATYPAPTGVNGPPMVGVDVTSMQFGATTGVDFLGLTLDIDLQLRMQRKMGSKSARGIGYGRRRTTGTARVYFENLDVYNMVLADGISNVLATASDGTNSLSFLLPRIRFTGGEVPNPGNDQDFTLSLTYQATKDPTLGTDVQVTRA